MLFPVYSKLFWSARQDNEIEKSNKRQRIGREDSNHHYFKTMIVYIKMSKDCFSHLKKIFFRLPDSNYCSISLLLFIEKCPELSLLTFFKSSPSILSSTNSTPAFTLLQLPNDMAFVTSHDLHMTESNGQFSVLISLYLLAAFDISLSLIQFLHLAFGMSCSSDFLLPSPDFLSILYCSFIISLTSEH